MSNLNLVIDLQEVVVLLHRSQASLICEVWNNGVIQKPAHTTDMHLWWPTFASATNLWIIVPAAMSSLLVRIVKTQHAKMTFSPQSVPQEFCKCQYFRSAPP